MITKEPTFKDKLKNSYKSMTIWVNSVVLAAMPTLELLKEYLPNLQEFLSGDTYKYIGVAIIVSNIALRFKTNKPLCEK